MAPDDFALFEAFPGLAPRLPRHPFLSGPTPVEPLALPGAAGAPLLVKREERSCPLYGGNKPRKLELLIGAALARGSRRLVTTGGLGTHHGLATTILGREAGLATSVVMVDQPLSREVEETLRLHAAWGAELLYGGGLLGAGWQAARVLARSAWAGERPYLVATGGSSPLGVVGFVSAAFELARQVREDGIPEPAELWIAVGSGGSLAGLVVGLRLAGLATRCVGVLVTDILPPSRESLTRRAQATLRLLRRLDPGIPELRFSPGDFDLLSSHLGPGYGAPTPEAERAVAMAAEVGLRLETTYTGKCLAALLPRLEQPLPAPVLFWNTFNAVDVTASAPTPLDSVTLPERFRRVLAAAG
jgi:D-cysteine desulfhydrase